MRKILPFLLFALISSAGYGQCDQLFFSEYVEGSGTNKALEIYNPTGVAVNMSGYSVARFSNGSTDLRDDQIQVLPDVMLEPYDVFVIVLDKREDTWSSAQDQRVWNGFNVVDTLFDFVTGEPRLDANGDVIFGPKFDDNANALYGSEYTEEYDLQCKADAFLCPVYDINQTMYFNGNDAMVLLSGDSFDATDPSNVIDVIGVIGENPGDAWNNEDGFPYSRNSTLVRKPSVATPNNNPNDFAFALGGTFGFENWIDHFNNDFEYLGTHKCDCDPDSKPNRFSCSTGPSASVNGINTIPFKMYPNPNSNSSLFIESETNLKRLEIFNLVGQKIISFNIDSNQTQYQFEASQLERGLYIVNVTFGNNLVSNQRLIVE